MNKKWIYTALLFALTATASGCSSSGQDAGKSGGTKPPAAADSSGASSGSGDTAPAKGDAADAKQGEEAADVTLADGYYAVLNAFMVEDQALNADMAYIAIDWQTPDGMNDSDKERLLALFEQQYGVEAMYASREELIERGLADEEPGSSLKGVLLTVKAVLVHTAEELQMEGSKFRSGTGAIFGTSRAQLKDGRWQAERLHMTAIS